MGLQAKSWALLCVVLLIASACKGKKGPMSPEDQSEFSGDRGSAISGDAMPIPQVESQDIILGPSSPGEKSGDSTQGNVPPGSNQQTPPAPGPPGAGTPSPTPPPATPPAAFYPANCAEIKKAKPNSASGVFKIYLNPTLETRVALDASCDMTEDGGGWTLILNYAHKAATNPLLSVRTADLPLLGGDTLGTDESTLVKSWGHTGNAMLANFPISELRFYCRSSQNTRIIHFKTSDVACISSAQKGTGNCLNVKTDFKKLTGHTGILPAGADQARADSRDLALTRDTFSQDQVGPDISWAIKSRNNDAWECDFGSNSFDDDTIHRMWFR